MTRLGTYRYDHRAPHNTWQATSSQVTSSSVRYPHVFEYYAGHVRDYYIRCHLTQEDNLQ